MAGIFAQPWRQATGLQDYQVPLAPIFAPPRAQMPMAPQPFNGGSSGSGGGFAGRGFDDGTEGSGSGDNQDYGPGSGGYDPFTDPNMKDPGVWKDANGGWGYAADSAPPWLKAVYGAIPGLMTGGLAGGAMGAGKSLFGSIFNSKPTDTGNLITQFDGQGRPIGGGQGLGMSNEGQTSSDEYMAALEAAQQRGQGQSFGASPGHVALNLGDMVGQRDLGPPQPQMPSFALNQPQYTNPNSAATYANYNPMGAAPQLAGIFQSAARDASGDWSSASQDAGQQDDLLGSYWGFQPNDTIDQNADPNTWGQAY